MWHTIGVSALITCGILLALFLSYEVCALVDETIYQDEYNITTGCRYEYIRENGPWRTSRDGKESEHVLTCPHTPV